VAVRGWGLVSCAVLVLGLTAGCSSAEGSADDETTTISTPEIVLPTTPQVLEAAADCSKSTVELAPEAVAEGVELTLSTDPSRTSLLVKNTGSLSVLILPDAKFVTRLVAAPYASPADQSSRVALVAVNGSGVLRSVRGLPPYLPTSQIVVLPPQWAVCALTDTLDEVAGVRYLRDKASSAEYFVTNALADRLIPQVDADKARPGLIRCARDTLVLLTSQPNLPDIELYAEVLGTRSSCYGRVKGLLGSNERAAQQLTTAALNELERASRLLANTRLYDVVAG
jgi:hypothetical protein